MRTEHYSMQKACESCGGTFYASRSHARTCGPTCKKRLQRGVDREGLGRRLGERKKRTRSAQALAATEKKGTDCQELRLAWPQDLAVRRDRPGLAVKPGRVDWKIYSTQFLPTRTGLVPVNMGFSHEWIHPAFLINMERRKG